MGLHPSSFHLPPHRRGPEYGQTMIWNNIIVTLSQQMSAKADILFYILSYCLDFTCESIIFAA